MMCSVKLVGGKLCCGSAQKTGTVAQSHVGSYLVADVRFEPMPRKHSQPLICVVLDES